MVKFLTACLAISLLLCFCVGCAKTSPDIGENILHPSETEANSLPEEHVSEKADEPVPDTPVEARNFKMRYYSVMLEDIMSRYASEKSVGPVDTADDAALKAEEVWAELYGEYIRDEKPYRVFWDVETQVWLVVSSGPKSQGEETVKGGCAYIFFEKESGNVLAVWAEK